MSFHHVRPIQVSSVGQSDQDFRLGSLFLGDHDLGKDNCEVKADPGVLDRWRMFDYCCLYYLGANFPIKKQIQWFIYSNKIYVLCSAIIK